MGAEGEEDRALVLMTPCSLPGTPTPQVTWWKGLSSEPLRGRPGLEVLDEGSLFLASVSPTDSGDYKCQATNEAGSTSRRAKLVVYGEQGPQSGGVHAYWWHTRVLRCGSASSPGLRAHCRAGYWGRGLGVGDSGRLYGQAPLPQRDPHGDSVRGRT